MLLGSPTSCQRDIAKALFHYPRQRGKRTRHGNFPLKNSVQFYRPHEDGNFLTVEAVRWNTGRWALFRCCKIPAAAKW